jgi:hypothetical protein
LIFSFYDSNVIDEIYDVPYFFILVEKFGAHCLTRRLRRGDGGDRVRHGGRPGCHHRRLQRGISDGGVMTVYSIAAADDSTLMMSSLIVVCVMIPVANSTTLLLHLDIQEALVVKMDTSDVVEIAVPLSSQPKQQHVLL